MNTQTFIETMVTVDFIKEIEAYGHYPFQMMSIDRDNKLTAGCLLLGGDIVAVYKAAKKLLNEGSRQLFLSVDFPACGDMKHDFVAVYTLTDRFVECVALPYDAKTGERFPPITTGKALYGVKKQFESIVLF